MGKLIRFTEEILNIQHITTLREIGRVLGVKSPTSKSKPRLIKDILSVQKGSIEPCRENKGAPSKTKIDISEFFVSEQNSYTPAEVTEEERENMQKNADVPYSELVKDSLENAELTFHDSEKLFDVEGVFEQHDSGYGFLRTKNYEISSGDVYISNVNIKKYQLKTGDKVKARAKFVKEGNSAAVNSVFEINNTYPEFSLNRDDFDSLTPCYPKRKIKLGLSSDISLRCIDLFSPIGRGQRGLIVAPPKAGKTTLIKQIAKAIEKDNNDIYLMVLLIDERPEEVTDIQESIRSEVIYSTFDQKPEHHIRVAELAINRAKRLAEYGTNVVVLLDSITRLTRAYNNATESSGKVLTGGLDPTALQMAKRLFGSARNTKTSGNITILATALVDTGSRMDDIIYEEFKSTGNMEVHLSRELSERRIFPAIDINKSGTRNEELLLSEEELSAVYSIRRILSSNNNPTDTLIDMMKKTKDNIELLAKAETWEKLYKS